MGERAVIESYLAKSVESLAGAESELSIGRFNNCANRTYYACFQAAVAALVRASIRPRGGDEEWPHTFVHGQFIGQLINRRHLYPTTLRTVLPDLQGLRHGADYESDPVTETEANRAVRRTRQFVEAIRQGVGTR